MLSCYGDSARQTVAFALECADYAEHCAQNVPLQSDGGDEVQHRHVLLEHSVGSNRGSEDGGDECARARVPVHAAVLTADHARGVREVREDDRPEAAVF